MCCLLVSGFLTEITQQIHSLRASGVISSHSARAAGSAMRTFCKSVGTACIAPEEIAFLLIDFLSTHTNSVLISRIHAAKQFAHRNAESAANCQQRREGRHSFATLDQTDRCSMQAALIGESLLAESLFAPQLPHSLA